MLLISLLCQEVLAAPLQMINEAEKAKIIQQEWNNQKDKSLPMDMKYETIKTNPVDMKEEIPELPKEFFENITLKVQGLPLNEVIRILSEKVGCNLIFGPGVEDSKVSANLSNVTVSKALNILLYPLGYDFKVKDGDLIILAVETRIFRIVLPPLVQDFNDVTSNESSVESTGSSNTTSSSSSPKNPGQQIKLGTKILVSNESSKISFWDDVKENLDILISQQGEFSINKPAGVVIVTDSPINLQKIEQYFEDLNHRVTQQIEVDVKVVEVSLNDENSFGVDWNALANDLKVLNSLGMATNFASQNFTNGSFFKITGDGSKPGSGVNQSGIKLAIEALAKQGHVEVVSQPRVRILNNQVAVIQVGSTQSYLDHSTLEVTQTGTITSISTSQIQEGVTMRLLANMVGDNIYLSVAPVVTTIDNIRSIVSGNTTIEAPQTTTKSINTLVKVKEGETVAIGGLITSLHQKNGQNVPVISKIPFLGKLFQYTNNKINKSELIIFITPKRG